MNVSLARLPLLAAVCCARLAVAADTGPEPTKEGLEFFEKNVRPILSEHCYKCHSVAESTSKGGLILDSRDGMLKGGDEGPAVVPGNTGKSLLLRAITYTDNETWAGNVHPAQALRQYRNEFVGDAKAVVVGMTSNGFSIADPNDRGMLDVVGFDTSVPAIIADFVRG